MARLTLILGVLATVIYLLDGFRFMLNEWRRWRIRAKQTGQWVVLIGSLCLLPSWVDAACSGSSPTWTAADTSSTEVAACVTAAVSGDTINVPAGASTWTTFVDISSKDITVHGSGSGTDSGSNTVITRTGDCFALTVTQGVSSASRITNFRFIDCSIYMRGLQATKAFRIDHNYFQGAANREWDPWGADSVANAQNPQGLIDHNTLELVRIVVFGTLFIGSDDSLARQHKIWSLDPGFGGSQAIFIEDNIINTNAPGSQDCNQGGHVVYRFNTVTMNSTYANEIHGVQGLNRACQAWEYYGNEYNENGPENFTMSFLRGGSGFHFKNTLTGGGFAGGASLKVERAGELKNPFGFCDGSWIIDGNTDANGWPCRDQIGRVQDSALYTGDYPFSGTVPWPDQPIYPVYAWDNLQGATQKNAYDFFGADTHLNEERDFYNFSSATGSPQTVGVRVGTLSDMNAVTTCTAGVGFWVTDQGSWNTSTSNPYGQQFSGTDGVLYVCGSSNNWTAHYTPYTYPHPLNIPENELSLPATSPAVIARIIRFMDIAVIVAGMGWHFRKQVMAVGLAAIAGCGTLYQLAPRSYETLKVVSKDSTVKMLTVFNHLTKSKG